MIFTLMITLLPHWLHDNRDNPSVLCYDPRLTRVTLSIFRILCYRVYLIITLIVLIMLVTLVTLVIIPQPVKYHLHPPKMEQIKVFQFPPIIKLWHFHHGLNLKLVYNPNSHNSPDSPTRRLDLCFSLLFPLVYVYIYIYIDWSDNPSNPIIILITIIILW